MRKVTDQVKIKYKELCDKVAKYQYDYYVLNKSTVSDYSFDKLFESIKVIEKNYPSLKTSFSPTMRVGGWVVNGLKKVKHDRPMLSMNKANSIEEVIEWWRKLGYPELEGQLKIDGLTLVVKFDSKTGDMLLCATRGGGIEGEDVTHNAITIKNMPLKVNTYRKGEPTVIRGEAVMPKRVFKKIQSKYEINDENRPKSARNLASGAIRNLDSKVCSDRELIFIAYDVINNSAYDDDNENLAYLADNGFRTICSVRIKSIKGLKYFIKKIGKDRDRLPYEIDGIVFKVADIDVRDEVGEDSFAPKWAIAYKYEDDLYETKLLDVEWNVSRTGRLNPVAIIEEVDIDGISVNRATLNNIEWINDLELGVGDRCVVKRANQVIPNMVESLDKSGTISYPRECPHCGSKTVKRGRYVYCTNSNCGVSDIGKLVYWTGATNMKGISNSKLQFLYDNYDVKSPLGLYMLVENEEELSRLSSESGWGKKSVDNLVNTVRKGEIMDLATLIYALGINGIGWEMANDLANYLDWNYDKFYNTMTRTVPIVLYDYLGRIDGFGDVTIKSIITYFENINNKLMLKDLIDNEYITIVPPVEQIKLSSKLSGKSFCITGKLSMSRTKMAEKIEQNGGEFVDGIKKGVQYLIVGENAGNNKLEDAKNKNVAIISEEEFNKMLEV